MFKLFGSLNNAGSTILDTGARIVNVAGGGVTMLSSWIDAGVVVSEMDAARRKVEAAPDQMLLALKNASKRADELALLGYASVDAGFTALDAKLGADLSAAFAKVLNPVPVV